MSGIVLDASVLTRWIVGEPTSAAVLRLNAQLEHGNLRAWAPALLPLEVTNAVLYSERRGLLHDSLAEVWQRATTWLSLVQIESSFIDSVTDAYDVAQHFNLTAYDASYLEMAVRFRFPLATLDRQLSNAARAAGVQVDF